MFYSGIKVGKESTIPLVKGKSDHLLSTAIALYAMARHQNPERHGQLNEMGQKS